MARPVQRDHQRPAGALMQGYAGLRWLSPFSHFHSHVTREIHGETLGWSIFRQIQTLMDPTMEGALWSTFLTAEHVWVLAGIICTLSWAN